MAIITDPDQITDGTEATITTAGRTITITTGGGNLPLAADGIAHQALYSWLKEEWKDDPNTKSLMAHPFPQIAITPEQFEWIKNWTPANTTTRKAIRTGGWREIDSDNGDQIKAEYSGIVTLGLFDDAANDNAYYQTGDDPTDTTATIDFDFPGPVNEAILVYEENVPADAGTGVSFIDGGGGNDQITRNDAGSFITDGFRVGAQITVLNATNAANNGTYSILAVTASTIDVPTGSLTAATGDNTATMARNYKNALKVFLRERGGGANGKTYAQADLPSIGVSEIDNKVFRFPISNATDLKIAETDANVSTTSPYTEVRLRYLDAAYNREVDSVTKRNFGIIVDVGTYSQSNGASASSTLFTSASLNLGAGEALADYAGGSLIIHEGTDQGTHTISGTPVDNAGTLEITLTAALTATESNLSFTMERATPLTATAEEIYEKVQYQLRQAADIDETANTVTGKTADELLRFVGDTLEAGQGAPSNPNGGGSGVMIEGFDSNDTNRITLYDNTTTARTFPFVAAGTINFNPNLVADSGPAEYTMFFEYTVTTNVTDLAVSGISGNNVSIDSAGNNLPTLVQNDYVRLRNLSTPEANGIYQITDATPTTAQADATKIDGEPPLAASGGGDLDNDPIDSDDAIIVNNNAGSPITGTIGASSVAFDFDYDNNNQGGRTPATVANVVIRAIGTDTAQYVETTGQITRNTGLTFSLVAGLERNYSNP